MGQPRGNFDNRGPVEVTSISTAITPASGKPPFGWFQVVTAGSGGLVVKDEGGVSRTYAGLLAGDTYYGPFTEFTSMTVSKFRYGDGKAPPPMLASSALVSTAAGQGASLVGIEDAGSYYAATTVEGALAEVVTDLAATTNGNGASRIGIEDSANNFTATNVETALAEIVSDLAATTATNGASRIGVEDSGSLIAATTVETALAEAFQHIKSVQKQINVPLAAGILAAGTPMAAWADNASSNPGVTLANSEAFGIRWNDNGTQTAVWYNVAMPQDLDDTAAIVLHALVSKVGATVGDATKLTVAAFFQTVSALHDADADCGGDSSAVVGDATSKTVSEITLSIAAGDVPPSPSCLSFSIKPKDGTLGTDDFICHALWFEYKGKALTA